MSDVNFSVSFDGEKIARFMQYEDRTLSLRLFDARTQTPLDLSGASVSLHLPRVDGGTIKRRSQPLSYTLDASTRPAFTSFIMPGHGFVTDDKVTLALSTSGSLPAPLSTTAAYYILVLDDQTFALTDDSGHGVALSLPAPTRVAMQIVLDPDEVVVTVPVLGLVDFHLSASVTRYVAAGQGQSIQVNFTDAHGLSRIFVDRFGLDVEAPPLP